MLERLMAVGPDQTAPDYRKFLARARLRPHLRRSIFKDRQDRQIAHLTWGRPGEGQDEDRNKFLSNLHLKEQDWC
jgi:hypothetical protein